MEKHKIETGWLLIEELYVDYIDGYAPAEDVHVSFIDEKILIRRCSLSLLFNKGFLYFPFIIYTTEVLIHS